MYGPVEYDTVENGTSEEDPVEQEVAHIASQ